MLSGVLIIFNNGFEKKYPNTDKIILIIIVETNAVEIQLLTSLYFFSPYNLELTTEQPILQPNANAKKISVIS